MPDPIFIDPQPEEQAIPPQQSQVAPSLTPMQQSFMSQLAAQPQATSVYQPAQSFSDPAYQQKLYEWEQEVRRTAEATRAEQAIQAGIRFIYQRRYDEDLKRGVPEQQAFSRMMLGIAMHGPKTDPIKAFEAFRERPAPQAQMMRFGTNEVPVIINTDPRGAQRATPVPQSALPPSPLPAAGEVLKHPSTGAEMGVRFPTGRSSGQILGVPSKATSQFDVIDYRTLGKRKELVQEERDSLSKSKDLTSDERARLAAYDAEIQRIDAAREALNPRRTQGATPATPSTSTPSTKKLYFNPETGQLQEKPYAR